MFVAAYQAATAYADTANANLKALAHSPPRLRKFDTKRMANALQREQSGETLHCVLHAIRGDREAPILPNVLAETRMAALRCVWALSNLVH